MRILRTLASFSIALAGLVAGMTFTGCSGDSSSTSTGGSGPTPGGDNTLFTLLPASSTGVDFQNTITELDGASNFNEAFSYISGSFEWDMEDDSVQLLLELVRRKFIVNQNE